MTVDRVTAGDFVGRLMQVAGFAVIGLMVVQPVSAEGSAKKSAAG
jgi:hypothetical protein